jgi:hypothetical protein
MTPPSDRELVDLCAQLYAGTVTWDHLDTGPDDSIYWALKKLDGFDVVVFRGSITAHDWIEDFRAFPTITRIGLVHFGFYDGMEKMHMEVSSMVTQPVMVTGHSLGAARADILCALMVAGGKPPARRAVFGEPRPGMPNFAAFLKDVPGHGYRNADANGHDYVTDVPPQLFGGLYFMHPTPPVDVTASPTGVGPFRYHHVELYQAAMAALKEPALC